MNRTSRPFKMPRRQPMEPTAKIKKTLKELELQLRFASVVGVRMTDSTIILDLEDDCGVPVEVWVLNDPEQPGRPLILDQHLEHLQCTESLRDTD